MNGRSIQDIIPPARSKPIRPAPAPVSQTPPPEPPMPPRVDGPVEIPSGRGKGFMPFVVIGLGAVIIVAAVVGLMSTVFHTATAEVTIAEWKSDVGGTYAAGGDVPLSYQPVVVEEKASRTVPATGTQKAEDRASGTIIVSNAYSTKSQRLITNTRFQTKDGLLFRIHSPITVPGYTTKNGSKVPGTVEALVYADAPGDSYNIGVTDFTLPGLKNSPQFALITARSKGPMSGGFVGTRAVVEKSVRDQAIADIRAELDRTVHDKVKAATPAGTVVFQDSVAVSYRENPDQADGSNATISVTATAVAPAFTGEAIARELALKANIVSDAPLTLVNPSELTYTAASGGPIESSGPISFTLAGVAHLVASFNPAQLAQDLAGKSKDQVEMVRTGYQSLIGPIVVKVYPFWSGVLPENAERITVRVKGALDQNP